LRRGPAVGTLRGMSDQIHGVILAAGASRRMETPKPLLEVGSETFLQRSVNTLREAGCDRVHVVLNAEETWAEPMTGKLGADLVMNDNPESEQIDSLRLVLRRLPADVAGVVVLPVDLPLVAVNTVRALLQAFRAEPGPLYLPFHNGVAGHPVLLGRDVFDEVLNTDFDEGVRSLIMAHARDLKEVAVTDPGILVDIDTPDDYWRYIQEK
jgi:molybdenum cofactor cytidylyltransferase